MIRMTLSREVLALLVAACFAGGAFAQRDLATPDRRFAENVASEGLAEVELGRIAQQKATHPKVKAFGQRMVADHGKANEELKRIAGGKGIKLPEAPAKAHQADSARLAKLSGEEFDRAYMSQMVREHRKDEKVFAKQSKDGKDAELKAFAARTLPTIQEHLKLAQSTLVELKPKVEATGKDAAPPPAPR